MTMAHPRGAPFVAALLSAVLVCVSGHRVCLGAQTTARAASISMRMPDAVRDMLPAEIRNHMIFSRAAEANWDALRACYPTEDAGLDAVRKCMAVVLPYGVRHAALTPCAPGSACPSACL